MNNILENGILPVALERENYLSVDTERVGKRIAAIKTILGTGKLNGFAPAAPKVHSNGA